MLLAAGASPNAKAPDGSTLLHQAVTARQVAIIKTLVAAGAKLDAVNKENLTPLLLAEKPEPVRSAAAAMQQDPGVYRPHRDSREDVIKALRELMKLGPDDPAPQPPPLAGREGQGQERREESGSRRNEKDSEPARSFLFAGAAVLAAQASARDAHSVHSAGACARGVGARSHRRRRPRDAAKYRTWLNRYLRRLPQQPDEVAARGSDQPRDARASTTCCRTPLRGSA